MVTEAECRERILQAVCYEAAWWGNWIQTEVPDDIVERAIWRLEKMRNETEAHEQERNRDGLLSSLHLSAPERDA